MQHGNGRDASDRHHYLAGSEIKSRICYFVPNLKSNYIKVITLTSPFLGFILASFLL